MPFYEKFADKFYEEGFNKTDNENKLHDIFLSSNRVKFDLFKKFGIIAAAGDRHLAEFLPASWYLKDRETVAGWKFMLTPVETRMEILKEGNELRKKIIAGIKKVEIKPTGEEGIRQIKALLGLGDLITNVNLPNRGQMTGFPNGAIVETNALFSRNSISPLIAGKLPEDLHNIVIRHSLNHELILKAVLERKKNLALSSLMNDPLVNLSPTDAKKMFDEMFEATKEYLHGW